MGAGYHGGFGNTNGSKKQDKRESNSQSLPKNDAQIKHIFSGKEGHLEDTPSNRKLLTDLANNKEKFIGTDKYGNSWNAEINSDGKQNWVRYQNGTINEGGQNQVPRQWDNETGYNNNPFKRRKKK